MTDLTKWIPADELAVITPEEQRWLTKVFERYGGYPALEQVWEVMDEPWRELNCDPEVMDVRIVAYYSHPVWLLNGLFIEQHQQSIENRVYFRDWVVKQKPKRVAEFGGGFGGLARMIGEALPSVEVEVIEPYPHPIAIARAEKTRNVRYRPELSGEYDVIIATDVFEHVPDPLQLAASTASHLRADGQFLIANCFHPVILCHLPQLFHFRYCWDFAMKTMGLIPADQVVYGRAFLRQGALRLDPARQVEKRSRALWYVSQYLPGRIGRPLTRALMAFL
jgi:2-polyprenyl-3-methyl-5-hydroxy-6-metoxy-1,4-benzoquinol methylase